MKITERKSYAPGSQKDNCGSPPYAVIPLIKQIEIYRKSIGVSREDFLIWEPAVGIDPERQPLMGLVEGFVALGYPVQYTYLVDFITTDFDKINEACLQSTGLKIRMIATNPPYNRTMKRKFLLKCEHGYHRHNIPWGMLMTGHTHLETTNRDCIDTTMIHVPRGRINFNMPSKGWGTEDKPTKATFGTAWYSKGLGGFNTIQYDEFDMTNHFKALEEFNALTIQEKV